MDEDVIILSTKAKWMLNGGRTSEDWDNLPISDIKLLVVYNSISEELDFKRTENAVRQGVYGKQNRQLE